MARPWRVFVPALAFCCCSARRSSMCSLSSPDATILPKSVPSRQGFELLKAKFGAGGARPGRAGSANTRRRFDLRTGQHRRALRVDARAGSDPRVARVDSITTIDQRIGLAQYQLLYAQPECGVRPLHRGHRAALRAWRHGTGKRRAEVGHRSPMRRSRWSTICARDATAG